MNDAVTASIGTGLVPHIGALSMMHIHRTYESCVLPRDADTALGVISHDGIAAGLSQVHPGRGDTSQLAQMPLDPDARRSGSNRAVLVLTGLG